MTALTNVPEHDRGRGRVSAELARPQLTRTEKQILSVIQRPARVGAIQAYLWPRRTTDELRATLLELRDRGLITVNGGGWWQAVHPAPARPRWDGGGHW